MAYERGKVFHFVGFLPYGLATLDGLYTAISGNKEPVTSMVYDPAMTMEQRLVECGKVHLRAKMRVIRLTRGGYIVKQKFKYGKYQGQEFCVCFPTKSGFFLLTNTFDDAQEEQRLMKILGDDIQDYDRVIKEQNYIERRPGEGMLLYRLNRFAQGEKDHGPLEATDRDAMDKLLLEAVRARACTLLARDSLGAMMVKISCQNGRELYRLSQYSDIEAMFQANGFLTSLDRRPIDFRAAGAMFNDHIEDDEDEGGDTDVEYDFSKEDSVMTYTRSVLSKWYSDHPEELYFAEPGQSLSIKDPEKRRAIWAQTPAFYSAFDLPGFLESRRKQIMRRTFLGVAVGKEANYMMYHAKPSKTPWIERVEYNSAYAVQQLLDETGGAESMMGANRDMRSAIIVCKTVTQFEAFMKQAVAKSGGKWRPREVVTAPFRSIHLLPLNPGGAAALRGLMLQTPVQYEESLVDNICELNPDFKRTQDRTFQLTYHGQNVLVIHDMSMQRLFNAWAEYKNGKRFACMCYPDEVKFIAKLMPDLSYL